MEYEVVYRPVKGTSSEYYRNKRAALNLPDRFCEYCGAKLERHYNPDNGRFECLGDFLKRKFCGSECRHKAQAYGRKAEREKVFSREYKPCGGIDTLYVNIKGEFYYKGRPKKVVRHISKRGVKTTARIDIMCEGRKIYFQASRLVAEAWAYDYSPDKYIEYIDGDIHNISADNLRVVSEDRYEEIRSRGLTPGKGTDNYRCQIDKLRRVKESTDAVLRYFETLDIEPINKIVRSWLYKELLTFNRKTLYMGEAISEETAGEVIARMYEVILNGHALYNLERYCKQLLVNYKKKGWYGYEGSVPKEIKIIVNNLNLDCLCEKYKVTYQKH